MSLYETASSNVYGSHKCEIWYIATFDWSVKGPQFGFGLKGIHVLFCNCRKNLE